MTASVVGEYLGGSRRRLGCGLRLSLDQLDVEPDEHHCKVMRLGRDNQLMNFDCAYHVMWTIKSTSGVPDLTGADDVERVADFIISNANGCV